MKNMLKYGFIFTIIYGAILLTLTIYTGRLMPAELGFIVPLWFLIEPLLTNIALTGIPTSSFLLIMVAIQVIIAFVQGAIIGVVVNIFSKKNNLA